MKVKVDDSFNNGESENRANWQTAPADEGWLVYTNTDGDWTQQALGDELPGLLIMLRRLTEANQGNHQRGVLYSTFFYPLYKKKYDYFMKANNAARVLKLKKGTVGFPKCF